eukprot:495820_1
MAEPKRYTGTLRKIISSDKDNPRKEYCKGFGFIGCDDGSEDVYVKWSNINVPGYFKKLNAGDRVSFGIEILEHDRRRAVNVEHHESDQIRMNQIRSDRKSDGKKASAKHEIKQELRPNIGHSKKTKTKQVAPLYIPHLELRDAFKLKIGDTLDHRDEFGLFALATITHKRDAILKIHYEGWSDTWDTWSDFEKELHRFAKPFSISQRPAHRLQSLKDGDLIYINPGLKHSGWKPGKIVQHQQGYGQVEVSYTHDGKNYFIWTHLDNCAEITLYPDYAKSREVYNNYVLENEMQTTIKRLEHKIAEMNDEREKIKSENI